MIQPLRTCPWSRSARALVASMIFATGATALAAPIREDEGWSRTSKKESRDEKPATQAVPSEGKKPATAASTRSAPTRSPVSEFTRTRYSESEENELVPLTPTQPVPSPPAQAAPAPSAPAAPSAPPRKLDLVPEDAVPDPKIEPMPNVEVPREPDAPPASPSVSTTDGSYQMASDYAGEGGYSGVGLDDQTLFDLETIQRAAPLAPNMLGDFLGIFYVGPPPGPDQNVIRSPEVAAIYKSQISFKAADNRSPRPQNRLWASYNYFNGIYDSSMDDHRNSLGGEIAFFDQRFSLELFSSHNFFTDSPLSSSQWGDLQFIMKGVMLQRPNVLLSWGLGTGFPTADRPPGVPGESVQFSPFVGYMWNFGDGLWFLQGYEQFDVMLRENRLLLHTDIGVGRWIVPLDYTRTGLTGLAPTLELHLYNPFRGGYNDDPPQLTGLVFRDVLNMTMGCTAYINRNFTIAAGLGLPLSNNHDYDFEFMLHGNWFFRVR
ncbi:MAG: hypothetical protein U1D30_13610 [Planctomycetota bacterium]